MKSIAEESIEDIKIDIRFERLWTDRYYLEIKSRLNKLVVNGKACCRTEKKLLRLLESIKRHGCKNPIEITVVRGAEYMRITEGNHRAAILQYLNRPLPATVKYYKE